jgi:hypothetical protein
VLTTNQKGVIAEAKIAAAAVVAGIGVAKPFNDERYDLIFDCGDRLLRVQCKWAPQIGNVIVARLYTNRRGRDGMITRKYSAGEFEAFALYCPDTDACYLLAADRFVARRQIHLRLSRSRNNQLSGVNWARDYEFGATLSRLLGPIAQLGEHLHGMQKAAGSSPAGSTELVVARTAVLDVA